MRASDIRSRFLAYFQRNAHAVLPSSSLVPGDDPTLLFTNAGMVQFKKVFLGLEVPETGRRATTSQKCVRAGGKHNDLEQVGHTARHHTFFEMLGNFSFGDYFKRDAIRFAWEFVTGPQSEGNLGIDARHVRVSVFHEDDEARALWREIAGISDARIYGLGAKDNFWQMADTGPCGPCSELYIDLAHLTKDWAFPAGASGEWTDLERTEFSTEAFVEGAEAGRFLEIWNLVFMQFDRQPDGTLVPLPKPSVDTGAGLERIAAVMQGVTNNFHTDVFAPMMAAIEATVQRPYAGVAPDGSRLLDAHSASYRVLADHARAVSFLLADGVFPSNEGRGYVLRRILRRAVRHAYLLGRREPTLVHVVQAVIDSMSDVFPELRQRATHVLETTRAEEERFLATIEGGMSRFEQLAPAVGSTQGSTHLRGLISGEDAFKLYDTYGFPIDLTELMARERGYAVDIAGFEAALGAQRVQSQEERKSKKLGVVADELSDAARWERTSGTSDEAPAFGESEFVGYEAVEIESQVTAVRRLDDNRVAVMLRETPFYAESGGQVSDHGEIVGQGWRVDVDDVKKIDGRVAAIGKLSGTIAFGTATARVPGDRRRDTERNHTATHLLHAALREALGDHVHQAGSLVAPDRLRFDFTHHGPIKPEVLDAIELTVNRGIWASVDVRTEQKGYKDAVAEGAMALFGEKYGDVVRVVKIPGLSVELCGGTHVRNTGQISLFKILSETGVAAGVRRIEAVTGPRAFEVMRERERTLSRVGELLKATPDTAIKRVQGLLDERKALEKRLDEAMKGGGDQVKALVASAPTVEGLRLVASMMTAPDVKTLQALGDALREQLGSGVAALGATFEDGKSALLVVATDDARDRGVRADAVIKELAQLAGGRGGGKPHMAQAGIPDAARLPDALASLERTVRALLGA
ncbi:MAG TPA: alanine--tRNA ligase [Gemmatimonadaceae bacterium]|nr:alanine--tRNA ligase [Gemmatimonadaceae bacterium]